MADGRDGHAARVLSDALTAADNRWETQLAMLDLLTAFDCVEHSILLQHLHRNLGLYAAVFTMVDIVLEW